ncbi:MAG: lysylphosphatidylglycerol synthase transmembrane domain-containing protein [Candidatus Cloacimonetes bacterium]|nr:flippase-like domain-containing protein [Candidatus Cloacimonadota bacterium]MDD3235301.1 lysylphosphatidylglycerol synthase transmembrane domain-containing protein [Candidatus Cloacimonadota bacterium]
MSRKQIISLVSGLAIGIVLLLAWLHFNPMQGFWFHFASLKYQWVILASLAYLSAYFIRAWRWNMLLPFNSPETGKKPGLFRTYLYAMGGNFINYLIPLRAGDVVRAWFIKRNHNIPLLKALPSVIIDKAFDTIAILFIIILLPFLAIQVSKAMVILLSLLALVFIVTLLLLLSAAWQKDFVIRVLNKLFWFLPSRLKTRVHAAIVLFVNELNVFEHHPLHLLFATLLTAVGLALDGAYFYLLFVAFGIPFSFPLALFGYTLINLSYALPQPPAQLGSNEWMMIIVFSIGFGLTKSAASAIMAFAHILTFSLMSFWGIIAFAISGKEVVLKIFKGEKIDD